MRKTKILKRLATITLSFALALSGVIPGMEPLEVQAGIITSTQISTDDILDSFNNDRVSDEFILSEGAGIYFSQDALLFIGDENTPYTNGSTWTNNSSQEYCIYQISHDTGSTDNLEIYLKPCSFSGEYSISVWFDHAFDYGTRETSAFTFELGNSTSISKDDIIAGMYEKFPSNVVIKDDKLYKNNSCTDYFSDMIDVTSSGWASFNDDNTYDWIFDAFVLVGTENMDNSSGSSTPSSTSKETKEEEKPIEVPNTPETHYGTFQEDAINKVQTAIANINKATTNGTTNETKKVELNTGIWVSFNKAVYEEIQKCNVPVTITFIHEGTRYVVTIPAYADVLSLVDENGYCGFLNLGAHYGYDSIEKL